jgi:DNA primase
MAGLIPQDFIDDLVARADIIEIVGRRIQLKKAGREFKACCPFHDEKTPSFTVSPAKGFYHCFGCGAHGTAVGFLMEFDHMSFVEAIESLAGSMGVEVPRDESDRPARRYDELFDLMSKVERFWQQGLRENQAAVDYLKDRGIDGTTAKRFGIGYAADGWSNVLDKYGTTPEAIERLLAAGLIIRKDNGGNYDRFRDRITFPIRDIRGRCIGFGGRAMGDGEPKYLNSPETVLFHKGRELYGLYEARQALRQIDRFVVVEGYMDVIALARHGIDFSVATLGTATTSDHLNRLFRLTENIHDPDSFVNEHGSQVFIDALNNGVALSDYLISELALQVDESTVDGRARLAELAKPLIAKIPPGVYRELLIESLADRVGLPAGKLEKMLGQPHSGENRPTKSARAPLGRSLPASAGKPSIVRRAITLLLNHPSAAEKLDLEKIAGVSRPGIDLLHDLIETTQVEPNITTAGLLERWRHHEQGRHLGKLAAVEVPEGEDFDPAAELADCIAQLALAGRRERIDFLIEKQRDNPLNEDEVAELRQLS